MDWALVANLIVNLGLPAAEKLIALWEAKAAVTLAEFQNIRAAAQQTARDRMLAQLAAAGIDPNSPQGQALLALASGSSLSPAGPPSSTPTPPA